MLFVETHDFVRKPEDSPNPGHGHHEFGNAETYFLVGDALGKGMIKLLTAPHEPRTNRPNLPSPRRTRCANSKAGPSAWTTDCCSAPDEELGTRALRFLGGKLADIKVVVPEDELKKLQSVTIVLDLTHGKLRAMQYHPSAGWLKANGYSTDLAKCVHLPRAADLPTRRNINEQPWVILHELAHAYHDQVLGFDEPRIREAYEKYKKSGHGEKTLLVQRQARAALRADQPQGVLRRDDRGLLRRQRFLPVQPGRTERSRAGDPRAAPRHLGSTSNRPRRRRRVRRSSSNSSRKMPRCWPRPLANKATRAAAPSFSTAPISSARAATPRERTTRVSVPTSPRPARKRRTSTSIESVLLPSKVVKKGYETVVITTKAGRTVTGLAGRGARRRRRPPRRRPGRQADHDPEEGHRRAQRQGAVADAGGLVNVLSGRQEFLDLITLPHGNRREGAGTRSATAPRRIPVCPAAVAGLRARPRPRRADPLPRRQSFKRGEAIYVRVCANCHGTKEQAGSLPTSLRFADGKFKNGSDPFRMYQTLTHGFGMMAPQTWMVPRAEVRRDPLHPRSLPEAAQPRPVREGRRRLPRRPAEGNAVAGRSRRTSSRG